MQTEIIIAGFGGQGVLFSGILLAQTAMIQGKHTTWFPSYGAEMRGGTANSIVIVSDEEIGSPVVFKPLCLIALNEQSLKKFLPRIKPGGLVIINSSLVNEIPKKDDLKIVTIPASELADKELKDMRVMNLIATGAFLKTSNILTLSSAQSACEEVLKDKTKLIELNKKALSIGYNFID